MSKIDNTTAKKEMSWKSFFILLGLIFLFRIFILEPHSVSGSSMDITFKDNDYVLVDKISYRFKSPEKGDVVVFNPPENIQNKDRFIKRIIATPGDTIMVKDGVTYINDTPIQENFVKYASSKDSNIIKLKDNEYFVMGDNRYVSYDSRYWGPITKEEIQGRVWLRLYPFNKISLLPGKKEYIEK